MNRTPHPAPAAVLAALCALSGCNPEPGWLLGPGDASLLLVTDGDVTVWLDGEHVGEAATWQVPAAIPLTLMPGPHALAVHLEPGDGSASFAAWTVLPDGALLASDGEWTAVGDAPQACWYEGACQGEELEVVDRGGFGSAPWIWQPDAMEGTGARWLAGAGGDEAWFRRTFEVGDTWADRWSVEPGEVEVGAATEVRLTFRAGTDGLVPGDTRTIANTVLDGSWGRGMAYPRWSPWQTEAEDAPGFLAGSEAPHDVQVSLEVADVPGEQGTFQAGARLEATLTVLGGEVGPGDEIVLRWGADGGVTVPLQARRYRFPHEGSEAGASMDYPGDTLGRSPYIEVIGAAADRLHVAVRGGAATGSGEDVTVQVTALDAWGNPARGHDGEVAVSTTDDQAEHANPVTLEQGSASFTVVFHTPGPHRVSVEGDPGGASGWLWVCEPAPAERPFFGDFHSHSLVSDGTWSAETSYRHADQVAALDFAAITDHAERTTDAEWDAAVQRAADLNRDDFVVLAGYEWTGREAEHRCLYSLDGEAFPIVRSSAFEYQADPIDAVASLWELTGDAALIVPHHPGSIVGPEHRWVDHDPGLEPVVEIYSKHGASECFGCEPAIQESWAWPEGNYVQDALAAGLRIGFVAAGDGHEVPLGGLEPDHQAAFGDDDLGPMVRRGGITAVWAAHLSRDGVFEALRARRCYATTGARIYLELWADDAPMGAELSVETAPTLTARVGGTDELRRVELVRYTVDEGFVTPVVLDEGGEIAEFTWIDEQLDSDAIYYLRVSQVDGHHAWSSPIWVDRE